RACTDRRAQEVTEHASIRLSDLDCLERSRWRPPIDDTTRYPISVADRRWRRGALECKPALAARCSRTGPTKNEAPGAQKHCCPHDRAGARSRSTMRQTARVARLIQALQIPHWWALARGKQSSDRSVRRQFARLSRWRNTASRHPDRIVRAEGLA